MPSEAELFSVHQGGVERIFVDHPELRAENIYGPSSNKHKTSSLTYMEAGQLGGLDLRYSILCQAALGAAACLPFTEDEVEPVFDNNIFRLEETTALKGSNGGGASEDIIPLNTTTTNTESAEQHLCVPSTTNDSLLDNDTGDNIVFVANDWPTALQILRLQYIIRAQPASPGTPSTEILSSSTQSPLSFRTVLSQRLLNAATVICIHNLAYQGIFPSSIFPKLCLPQAALKALDPGKDWKKALDVEISIPPSSIHSIHHSTPTRANDLDIDFQRLITDYLLGNSDSHSSSQGREADNSNSPSSSRKNDAGLSAPCGCPVTEPCTCPPIDNPTTSIDVLNTVADVVPPIAPVAAVSEDVGVKLEESENESGSSELNFMRAGLVCADEIVTVSPTYAEEIQTDLAMGCGLQDILIAKGVT